MKQKKTKVVKNKLQCCVWKQEITKELNKEL